MPRAMVAWVIYCGVLALVGYGQMARKIAADSGGLISQFGPAPAGHHPDSGFGS